jgi:hypothetical protein
LKFKNVLKQNLKKFMKMNSGQFIDRIIDIYYEGSLKEELSDNGFDGLDFSVESKVIAHFCTGSADAEFSEMLNNNMLTEWLIFKKNLLSDDEAKDMYFILLNIYSKLNNIKN